MSRDDSERVLLGSAARFLNAQHVQMVVGFVLHRGRELFGSGVPRGAQCDSKGWAHGLRDGARFGDWQRRRAAARRRRRARPLHHQFVALWSAPLRLSRRGECDQRVRCARRGNARAVVLRDALTVRRVLQTLGHGGHPPHRRPTRAAPARSVRRRRAADSRRCCAGTAHGTLPTRTPRP